MSIVQLSRFLSFFSSDSFDSISKCFSSVKNFFHLFLFCFLLAGQLKHITIELYHLSTVFYKFFHFFFPASNQHNIWYFYKALPTIPPQQNIKTTGVSSSFSDNTERRRRDLNPRAATNDLLPFQGSPFGQLGYFSKMSAI